MSFVKKMTCLLPLVLSSAVSAQGQPQVPQLVPGNSGVSGAAQPSMPGWTSFALIGGMFLLMWLFVIRPQSKRAKEQRDFLASLTAGIEVITVGGVIGTVAEVKENIVCLNIGNNQQIRILKSSISGRLDNPTATQNVLAQKQ